jgi:hypothetical protein
VHHDNISYKTRPSTTCLHLRKFKQVSCVLCHLMFEEPLRAFEVMWQCYSTLFPNKYVTKNWLVFHNQCFSILVIHCVSLLCCCKLGSACHSNSLPAKLLRSTHYKLIN